MRCSRAACLLVVIGLITLAPSGLALPSDGSASGSSGPQATVGSLSALWYPPYNPATNYCGPEWLQEGGWGWVVPREPIPGFDFSPACYVHDACYTECCENHMSQADCDGQFLNGLKNICTDTKEDLLGECSGWGTAGCVLATMARYWACLSMAQTYASAVSYLGDGVIETQQLALLLAPLGLGGVATAFAIATLAGDIEIEAAYPCPCACITCPPDELLGTPTCQQAPLQRALVTQNVKTYQKEATNVSGVGPVCECVEVEETRVTRCPAGATCAANGQVCSTDVCDPATCNGTEVVSRCEPGLIVLGADFNAYGTLIFESVVSACQAVDEYRSECVTTSETLQTVRCPSPCALDRMSCELIPHSSLELRVMEPTTLAAHTHVPCPQCRVQLEGAGGTFQGTTATDGTVTLNQVPAGIYVASYGCGPDDLGSHRPSDLLALYPSEPVSWVTAQATSPSLTDDLPAVIAPGSGVVDVLTGFCGPAPACSASDMWPLTITTQNLPPPVLTTRHEILEAALTCDYDTLAELASFPGFAYLVGEAGADPAGYWQSLEESGVGQPLRDMVIALTLPVEAAGVGGTENAFYLWSDGTGGATEYRLGIADDGRWLFFLPDD